MTPASVSLLKMERDKQTGKERERESDKNIFGLLASLGSQALETDQGDMADLYSKSRPTSSSDPTLNTVRTTHFRPTHLEGR